MYKDVKGLNAGSTFSLWMYTQKPSTCKGYMIGKHHKLVLKISWRYRSYDPMGSGICCCCVVGLVDVVCRRLTRKENYAATPWTTWWKLCYAPLHPTGLAVAVHWSLGGAGAQHNQVKRAHFSLRWGLAFCVCPCSVGMYQPMLRCAASVELIRSTRTARQELKATDSLSHGDAFGHGTAGWSCHLSGICLVFIFWTLLYILMSSPFHIFM